MKGNALVRTRILVGLLATAFLLSGCAGTQYGAAAVVDGEKISVATVEASVTGVLNQRRQTGEQDSGTVRSGQDARDQMRFHIVQVVLRQIAEERGITIEPGERNRMRQQILQSVGGQEALLIALTQNAIAEKDLDTYIESVIYQQKLGALLVAGEGQEVQGLRNEAVQKAVQERMQKIDITVNPRFGVYDRASGMIMTRENTNGTVVIPSE